MEPKPVDGPTPIPSQTVHAESFNSGVGFGLFVGLIIGVALLFAFQQVAATFRWGLGFDVGDEVYCELESDTYTVLEFSVDRKRARVAVTDSFLRSKIGEQRWMSTRWMHLLRASKKVTVHADGPPIRVESCGGRRRQVFSAGGSFR